MEEGDLSRLSLIHGGARGRGKEEEEEEEEEEIHFETHFTRKNIVTT
jgi:hypothetical protein